MSKSEPKSAYFLVDRPEVEVTHTLSILVDDEPGVLARVIGLFSGRGYNIESLTVSETEHESHLSRITIVTKGTLDVLEQIKSQLARIVPVHAVKDLTAIAHERGHDKPLERELALVKVKSNGENRLEALHIASAFKAEVVDATRDHFIFQMTGRSPRVDQFVEVMAPLGLVEVCKTGVAAVSRGAGGMMDDET